MGVCVCGGGGGRGVTADDTINGMSGEQQQPGQLSRDWWEGRGECVRPEDCDCILRPVWRREGHQDCKPEILPLLLQHTDRATGL